MWIIDDQQPFGLNYVLLKNKMLPVFYVTKAIIADIYPL